MNGLCNQENDALKKAVIFGAAERGRIARNSLTSIYEVVAYLDNNPNKQRKSYDGLDVLAPDVLKDLGDCDIIVAVKFPYTIAAQLDKMKLPNQTFLFELPIQQGGKYHLYPLRGKEVCIPEFMNAHYVNSEEMRCHYRDLPEDTLRLFRTALNWMQSEELLDGPVLELGCGSGQFANMLFDGGCRSYTGYDFSSAAIARAKEMNPAHSECFVNDDIRNICSIGGGGKNNHLFRNPRTYY